MKKLLLVSICSAVLLCVAGHVSYVEAAPVTKTGMRKLVKFLSPHNVALDKALDVHNLMTELPKLKVVAAQQVKVRAASHLMKKFHEALMKCNEQRFSRFQNAKEVLAKVRDAYGKRTQQLEANNADNTGIMPSSIMNYSKLYLKKKQIEQELVSEALSDGKKWGGKSIDQQQRPLPENLSQDIQGTGFEELILAEQGLNNAQVASADYATVLLKMQQDFVKKLADVGVSMPDFDISKPQDIHHVQEELKKLKDQYLAEAESYIVKLDAQDVAHPDAVARRESRSQNKRVVLKQVQDMFPDEFASMSHFDQRTPQDRQRMLITAMKKDAAGSVFLTETNALEIDQLMAESKSTANLISTFEGKADDVVKEMQQPQLDPADFDFSRCSG